MPVVYYNRQLQFTDSPRPCGRKADIAQGECRRVSSERLMHLLDTGISRWVYDLFRYSTKNSTDVKLLTTATISPQLEHLFLLKRKKNYIYVVRILVKSFSF